jgi:hypothetical protein
MSWAYELVVNTAPAPNFCMNKREHSFTFKEIAILEQAEYPDQPPNTVIYNAYPQIDWVRSSRIFDAEVTEWDLEHAPRNALIIKKPLATNCDCQHRTFRTGRFGAWHNETWIDHAYFDTYQLVTSMVHHEEWGKVK